MASFATALLATRWLALLVTGACAGGPLLCPLASRIRRPPGQTSLRPGMSRRTLLPTQRVGAAAGRRILSMTVERNRLPPPPPSPFNFHVQNRTRSDSAVGFDVNMPAIVLPLLLRARCASRVGSHAQPRTRTGCAFEFGVDFFGHDLKSAKGEGRAMSFTAECAALCEDTPRCSHFTHVWGRCYLKHFVAEGSAPRPQAQRNATSGVCRHRRTAAEMDFVPAVANAGSIAPAPLPLGQPSEYVPLLSESFPTFVIGGVQKGGTSALHGLLNKLPEVCLPTSETHYFDNKEGAWNVRMGSRKTEAWYRKLCTTRGKKGVGKQKRCRICGETSPSYMLGFSTSPSAEGMDPVQRMKQFYAGMKWIILLREPVSRAYSEYGMCVRGHRHDWKHSGGLQGYLEVHSFEANVWLEANRSLPVKPNAASKWGTRAELTCKKPQNTRGAYYLARGFYAEQLEHIFAHFPREQVLVLFSEELHESNDYTAVETFLGLTNGSLTKKAAVNTDPRAAHRKLAASGNETLSDVPPINPATRRRLMAYFAPHNARLEKLLGRRNPPAWHFHSPTPAPLPPPTLHPGDLA